MCCSELQGGGKDGISSCKIGRVAPEIAIAEAIGVREALSWIKEQKWERVTVETDCLASIYIYMQVLI